MRYRFRQKTVKLLLSALVLTWGIVPPGVQHAHSGGSDATHQHGDRDEVAHNASHSQASHNHEPNDEHHDHAAVPDISLLADCVIHRHWWLFGLEFSMPVPEEPADGTGDKSTVPPVIVRVTNDFVLAAQASPSFDRVLLAGFRAPSADVVRSLKSIPHPPNLVTSIPLCDSARLERSGVFLA